MIVTNPHKRKQLRDNAAIGLPLFELPNQIDTSTRDAANKTVNRKAQYDAILSALKRAGRANAWQLATITGFEYSSISGRCSEMENKLGMIEVCGKEPGRSGVKVKVYRVR